MPPGWGYHGFMNLAELPPSRQAQLIADIRRVEAESSMLPQLYGVGSPLHQRDRMLLVLSSDPSVVWSHNAVAFVPSESYSDVWWQTVVCRLDNWYGDNDYDSDNEVAVRFVLSDRELVCRGELIDFGERFGFESVEVVEEVIR